LADLEPGRTETVYIDAPGNLVEIIRITDPHGTVVDEDVVTNLGQGRFEYTIPSSLLTTEGVWKLDWLTVGLNLVKSQRITVGRRPLSAISKSQLRSQVARRVDMVHVGTVYAVQGDAIVDTTLLGGATNYVGWWVVINEGPLRGMARRVVQYNASAMKLSSTFPVDIAEGTSYTLMRLDPREVDEAINTAFADFMRISRTEVTIDGVPIVNGVVQVPEYVTHVSGIFNGSTMIGKQHWSMLPGRRIEISENYLNTNSGVSSVSINGMRNIAAPVWEFSTIDVEPQALIARAAFTLHANRAAGPGVDIKEHLRRQLAALNEQEQTMRRATARLSGSSVRVIE
jgi:hypothetical protein